MNNMRIYIICPVRNANPDILQRIAQYVNTLELDGYHVHYPPRDAPQADPTGRMICEVHRKAMNDANEVHVFWDVQSSGSHFDLGMAYALKKKIVAIECIHPDNDGKSYWKAVICSE